MKFPVVACKSVVGKDSSVWYAPTVVLPDGDTHQFFGRKAYKVGDELDTTTRKMTFNGRAYLVIVAKE